MPFCFLCSSEFSRFSTLFVHFKLIHKLGCNSIYRCQEDNCLRDFSDLKTYKRHINRLHLKLSASNNQSVEVKPLLVSSCLDSSPTLSDNTDSSTNVEFSTKAGTSKCLSPEVFKCIMRQQALTFIATLYNSSFIPRNYIQVVIDNITECLSGESVSLLKDNIISLLNSLNADNVAINNISEMLSCPSNPFKGLSTEYLRFKQFEQSSHLVQPVQYVIGAREEKIVENGSVHLKSVEVTAQFVPLRTTLKKLFQMQGFFAELKSYMKHLDNNIHGIENILQSPYWHNIKARFDSNDIVLPLFMYFDDYESGNALSSHAGINKLGAVYITVACLSPQLASALDNILLALLFHSTDRKQFGNLAVFKILIEELKFLETDGIKIETSSGTVPIKFALALILGDNLGLHSILGYSESFNAEFNCRFCKIKRNESHSVCEISTKLLRTPQNYSEDILLNDISRTGIKENCIFNVLPHFHATTNYSVDIMHDLLEGVCHYDMLNILKYFILDVNVFSLDVLNFRMSIFNCKRELSNKLLPISKDFATKTKLNMSASEMLNFVRIFPLLVGELIPQDNDVWSFFLVLREILDIVFCNRTTDCLISELECLIVEHNRQYMYLFKDTLKPKFHHLLHYTRVMREIGPLSNISSMRYESKHRDFKSTANVTCSRKNICRSLVLKYQLKFCYRLMCNNVSENKNNITVGPCEFGSFSELLESDKELANIVPKRFEQSFVPKWIKVGHYQYCANSKTTLAVGVKDLFPLFGVILKIIVNKNNEVCFLCKSMQTLFFSDHLYAYKVVAQNNLFSVTFEDLLTVVPVITHTLTTNHSVYIVLPHRI